MTELGELIKEDQNLDLRRKQKQDQQEKQELLNQEEVSASILDFLTSVIWSRENLYSIAKKTSKLIAQQQNYTHTLGVEIVKKEIVDVVLEQCKAANSELRKNVAGIPSEILNDTPISETTKIAASMVILDQLKPEIQEAKAELESEKISKQNTVTEEKREASKEEDNEDNSSKEKQDEEDDTDPRIDTWTKRELVLSVENDSDLYDRMAIPLAEAYIRKLRKG
jgi:hypothetical protein